MSKYDELRKAMGLQPEDNTKTKAQQYREAKGLDKPVTQSSNSSISQSKYDDLRMDMGIIEDTRSKTGRPMSQLMSQFGNVTPSNMINARMGTYQAEKPTMKFGPSPTMAESMQKFGSMQPQNSLLMQAIDNPAAQDYYKQFTGIEFKPETQYDTRIRQINEGNIPEILKPVAKGTEWLLTGNPVGKFISNSLPSDPNVYQRDSTGSKVADVTSNVFNAVIPAPSGAPFGGGPIAAPYKAVDNFIAASPKLQGIEAAAAKAMTAGGKIKPQTAQVVTRDLIREGAAGAIQGPAMSMMQGQPTNEELLQNAGMGFLGGAGLGAAAPLIGQPIKSAINNRRVANALMQNIKNTELPVLPTPGRSANAVDNVVTDTIDPDLLKQNWFTNLFGDTGVGIVANPSRSSSGRMLSTQDQIVNSPIKNNIQGVKDSAAAQARATYQNFVDYLDPLKKVSDDTYRAAMDASRSNNIANTIVRDAFVTPEGQVVGESLESIFRKVPRGQDKNFIDYLTLRHAETRMARGERVYDESLNMTPDAVRSRIEMFDTRYPAFQQLAKQWDQFNDNVLKHLGVNEGLISDELYQAMREKNPFYSPMRRQFSKSEKPGRNFISKTTSSSFSGQKAPIKEVSPTGSVRKIVDPRRTTIESVGAWTNAAMRNRTMQSLVDAIKKNPEGLKGIAEIVQSPTDKRNLRDILINDGVDDFVEAIDSDFKSLFKTTRLDGDNIVRAMVDGQPVHIQVHDPELVKTLIGMGPQASNALVDVFGALSNATKRGATGLLAPVFAVKGATMDLVQSAIQAKNPAQQMAYTVYGIISGIADRFNIPVLRNMAQDFRRAGGEYSAALKGDRSVNKRISDMTRNPILSPQGVAQSTKKLISAPFKALEAVGDVAENAPRMAAYKLEMKRLGNEMTPENVRKAMEQAREITVNFSRKGALTRDIEAFVPYNNAAVQGTYRILRAFKKNPFRTITSVAALAILPKFYEYSQFADDPDYQQLPARERYRFLIVSKNDDGTFVKIPMEPAYNSFGELTIEALRAFKDNDPTAFKGMADALANAWLPPAATGLLQGATQGGGIEQSIAGTINSTVAAPFVALTSNQSYTGGPIVPQSLQDRSPKYQYDERTSSIAKEFGKYMNMSPMKVDYLIRAYGGDPARLLLPLTSEVGAGNVRNTLLKNFIVDPQVSNTLSNDFYTARENLTKAYRDNQEAGAELPSWYSEELRKLVTSTSKGSISKKLSSIRTQIKDVSADKTLSDKEKTNKLRELRKQMNTIYVDVNQRLEEAGVPLK